MLIFFMCRPLWWWATLMDTSGLGVKCAKEVAPSQILACWPANKLLMHC